MIESSLLLVVKHAESFDVPVALATSFTNIFSATGSSKIGVAYLSSFYDD